MNNQRPATSIRPTIHVHGRTCTVDDALGLALKQLYGRNPRGALAIYDAILAAHHDNVEAHNNRGIALQEMQQPASALASYDAALALQPDFPDALLNRGNVLLLMRRLDEALSTFDRLVAVRPDNPAGHNSRGIALQELKRPNDALASYDRALALKADHVEALNNRGLVLRKLSRSADALADYDRVLALQPRNLVAHNNRGLTLQEMKRHEDALASFDRAVALEPNYAIAHNNRGVALRELHRFDDALAAFDRSIACKPDYAVAHNNRGLLLKELMRFVEALASFDRAIALQPGVAMTHNNRALVLRELNRFAEALASCDRALELNPDLAEAHSARGAILSQQKLYDEALASCDRAIALRPEFAEPYQNRGVILLNKGDIPQAEQMFRRAMELDPDLPMPLFSLTRIRKYTDPDHPDIRAVRAMLEKPLVAPAVREYLYFALGKIYDDCADYDTAFDCYRRANEISKAAAAYDPARTVRITDAIIATFSRDFLARPSPFASASRSPIFIVGMPRSGTTLMASILSNHRAIATAGELPTLGDLAGRLPQLIGTETPYPRAVESLTREAASRATTDYETRLRRDAGPDVPHVIDKNPLNFRHLGLVALLFPNARIVHCVRDPLDTCLSVYFQNFSLLYDFSFDLRDVGHFHVQYQRLMNHWRDALPAGVMDVKYEDMVANTTQVVTKALDFLGLEWDERCLAPHTNPAPVETASNWQVRQPIYRDSLERWRHYEQHLGPLKEALRVP
jgi:tetratricopeptide (TPR) repeat protein